MIPADVGGNRRQAVKRGGVQTKNIVLKADDQVLVVCPTAGRRGQLGRVGPGIKRPRSCFGADDREPCGGPSCQLFRKTMPSSMCGVWPVM